MRRLYIKCFAAFAGIFFLSACSTDFLEVKPVGTDLEENYYRNAQEAYNGLVATYDVVGWIGNNLVTKVGAVNSASDDHYAGGGNATDINQFQVWSNYTLDPAVGPQEELWRKGYSGIFRANVLLSKLPDIPMDENLKARYVAEAKFLRAFFYFDLIRFFRNIPLILNPISAGDMYDVPQAPPADVYLQIEQDLTDAIAGLPGTVAVDEEGGRATEGAARALLGKVYLQQEKFDLAAQQLAEVNGVPGETSQFGYQLLDDFGDLWVVPNKHNTESIFEVNHTNASEWGDWGCIACTEGNFLSQMVGPRNYNAVTPDAPDYVSGWSFNVITPELEALMSGDPRYEHTIANLAQLEAEGKVTYEKGFMDTGFFLEKLAGRVADRHTGAGVPEGNFPQNMYEIRLADSYLMEAEALVRGGENTARAQALLDAVRARLGLGSVPATFDNIKLERRLELVGEGHRWFDLVRWGDAADALADRGFVAGKHEVLPIPLLELENTLIEQNKEYGGTK